MPSSIISTGSYLPEKIINNNDLTQFPPNSIGLILQKTGILMRRHAAPEQATSDLAVLSARQCLGKVNLSIDNIDAIIVATSSPDRIQPATAARVQQLLGAKNAFAFDINSVCSGGVYALAIADGLINNGKCKFVLVIASEIYSRFLNPKDFSTYPYFGDGSGAVLLGEGKDKLLIKDIILRTDGNGYDLIQVPAGGTMLPGPLVDNEKDWYFKMSGKEVFAFAVRRAPEIIKELLTRNNIQTEQVSAVIAHQANINIIREISTRSEIPFEKFYINLDKYGNTAGASVHIALDEYLAHNNPIKGGYLVLCAFGGGLSWCTALIKL
jgi:3-oxoacyl-[acyl-carrier-protein] synthase-3